MVCKSAGTVMSLHMHRGHHIRSAVDSLLLLWNAEIEWSGHAWMFIFTGSDCNSFYALQIQNQLFLKKVYIYIYIHIYLKFTSNLIAILAKDCSLLPEQIVKPW